MRPEEDQQKKFAQMYINDGNMEEEAEMRMNSTRSKLDKETLLKLQTMLHNENPYVKSFKALIDLPEEMVKRSNLF